ncbi:telomere-protecting terminal protein Tpg [Streptomyces griseoluteus]|uniref:telomere-protecting terminal protein Tpg n=1 Tax=Streptomyces griseoluteus TaxID=29306 RepID=UPI0037006E55
MVPKRPPPPAGDGAAPRTRGDGPHLGALAYCWATCSPHPRGWSCQLRWCLEDAVRARWQPRIRAQARKQAATSTGLVLDTRARFGFTAAPGTTDDARIRHLTLALPPHHAARLFDAQDQGAGEQQLRALAAEALGEVYFRDGGRRAAGLEVEFTDVEHVEFDL